MSRAETIALHGATRESVAREDNKLRPEDHAAHGWYRFVLSFPPHLVRDYIQRFGINSRQRVLDPFCGTGTTLVECKKLGIPSVGIESNPMACFASQVKVDWNVNADDLLRHASVIARRASVELEAQGFPDDADDLPLFSVSHKILPNLRALSADAWKLLLKDSISPRPLHKVLVLLDAIDGRKDARFNRHERLALAKALVFGISNLHFGPEVGVRPAKADAPVIASWLKGVRAMSDDLRELRGRAHTQAVVHQADSRCLLTSA